MTRRLAAHRETTAAAVALLAVGLLAAAGGAAGQSGSLRRIFVPRTESATGAEGLPTRVRIEGEARPVADVSPIERWRIVIAVDPALSSPESADRAAALLAPLARRLTDLGDVELVVVDTLMDERLSATRDTEAVERALTALPGAGAWGDVLDRRSAVGPRSDRIDRLEAARDELLLVRWQREALVDWLLEADAGEPKALFLLADAFDLRQQEAYGLEAPLFATPPPGAGSAAFDDAVLGPALAATGWVVFPLALSDSGDTVRPGATHRALAEPTGGRVVTNAAELDAALDSLAGAVAVGVALQPLPTGPLRLEVDPPGAAISPPAWIGGVFVPGRAAARARRFLAEGEGGELRVEAAVSYEGPDADSVVLEVRADLDPPGSPPTSTWLTLGLYLDRIDAPPLELELRGNGQSLAGIDRWVTQSALVLPDEPGELVAVVSDGLTGRWGAVLVEDESDHLARRGPGLALEHYDLRPPAEETAEPEAPTVITLLAPRGADLSGRQRFRTLVTASTVASVNFSLDGEVVETDDDAPFAARIDLGRGVERHTVRVDAYDVLGNLLGSDSIRLNEPSRSFDVSLTDVSLDRAPRLELAADVSHPTDVGVERLEFYYNEDLLTTLAAEPWRAETTIGEAGQTDYVRVVAYFADGRFLEDVRLLSALGTAEEVEVNLVQVYVVATDKQGQPIEDLAAEDFEVRLRGERQTIDRFAYADEVPLLLSLVIDTSGSMFALMPDTKKAAGRFLTQVLTERDRALVVDFDNRPRIAAALTDDIGDLLLSLGTMEAEKNAMTALYDSVIFGALELPSGQHRKAVVLLTDGDDTRSRFSLGRAIDTAKQAGVPVYVVSLAGIHDPRLQSPRPDVNALTAQTGGEAFYLGAMSDLARTYDHIARELRSQYMLAFPTERELSERDIDSIEVRVSRPDVEIRTVVGGRSVD